MSKRTDWEEIEPLGTGGQSEVFLVRSPARVAERERYAKRVAELSGRGYGVGEARNFAEAAWNYARPDLPSELGALKVFKIPPKGSGLPPPPRYEPLERLKNEIAALSQGRAGLPKLLDFNEDERWIVTEYFPERTLEHHPFKYKEKVLPALKAFRSLVQTVAALHQNGFVHRDIKPANVFIRKDDELVLGDFGIVYVPGTQNRVTRTGERVGPRDYMPQWANLGVRHENVQPNFDVYMLGKLLWSMIDGRALLPREYHRHPEHDFDLTRTFPNDPDMHLINLILDKCVVEQARQCLSGAQDLLLVVDEVLGIIESGGQLLKDGVPRPCHVCGLGLYQPEVLRPDHAIGFIRFWFSGASATDVASLGVQPFICSNCGHVEFFRTS